MVSRKIFSPPPGTSSSRLSVASRHKKSKKILSVLSRFVDLSACDLLDIGTGSGHIVHGISKKCKSATSVDIYDHRIERSGYKFKKVEDAHLPFPNGSFDVVLSNHVIEHIPNQRLHLEEIYRILKKNGILYLATPNKYWIIENHYRLPFLSWLPRRLSSLYLKIIKRNKIWDIYPLSYAHLKQLTMGKFEMNNLTIEIIKNPEKYNLDVYESVQQQLRRIPGSLLQLVNSILPTYVIILRKK